MTDGDLETEAAETEKKGEKSIGELCDQSIRERINGQGVQDSCKINDDVWRRHLAGETKMDATEITIFQ